MDSSEYYEQDDRYYINPTLSSGEQEEFISNLRGIQSKNNAQIAEQTYNLGTRVPSNLGGLGGGEAYFNARYQTPQVNEMVATLETAAQAQALNDVMSNYQAQLKQRYNNAYRRAQKRARARAAAAAYRPSTAPLRTSDDDVVQKSTEEVAGLTVGRDELARRNLTGKTIFDVVDEMIAKRKESRPTPQEATEKTFGDAFTSYQIGK